jgi:hypothetical protein
VFLDIRELGAEFDLNYGRSYTDRALERVGQEQQLAVQGVKTLSFAGAENADDGYALGAEGAPYVMFSDEHEQREAVEALDDKIQELTANGAIKYMIPYG